MANEQPYNPTPEEVEALVAAGFRIEPSAVAPPPTPTPETDESYYLQEAPITEEQKLTPEQAEALVEAGFRIEESVVKTPEVKVPAKPQEVASEIPVDVGKTMYIMPEDQYQQLVNLGIDIQVPVHVDPQIPSDAKVSEYDANGNPSVYVDNSGEKWFTPYSTSYQMGWRKESDRIQGQDIGHMYGIYSGSYVPDDTIILLDVDGNPYQRVRQSDIGATYASDVIASFIEEDRYRIPVKTARGEVLITPAQSEAISKATSEESKFELMKSYGIVDPYVSYKTPEQVQAGRTESEASAFEIQQSKKRAVDAIEKTLSQQPEALRDAYKELSTMPKFLQDAYERNGIVGYNLAVNTYNETLSLARAKYPPSGETYWVSAERAEYAESPEYLRTYKQVMQPYNMPDSEYNSVSKYVKPAGFDSKQAFQDNASIDLINKFTLATITPNIIQKIENEELVLLPYGQFIEKKVLDELPPTTKKIIETSGVVGYEDYIEKIEEQNKKETVSKNFLDAVVMATGDIVENVKKMALVQLQSAFPEVQEGDIKEIYKLYPQLAISPQARQMIGGIRITKEEAEEANLKGAEFVKLYEKAYNETQKARDEWVASHPLMSPIYKEGVIEAVKQNPMSLLDPNLYSETIAGTLPYTIPLAIVMTTGVYGAPVAFGLTFAVEGQGIYEEARENGANHEEARELANLYGALSAAVETVGDVAFVKVLGGMTSAIKGELGKNVAEGIIKGAAKKYGWKNLTKDVIVQFVNQGGQESVQEILSNAAVKTVNENKSLLEGSANAFVSGVIGSAPFVLIPAGGTALRIADKTGEIKTVDVGKGQVGDITPAEQVKILNKILEPVDKVIDKTTIKDSESASKLSIAYNEMVNKIREYAFSSLELKQIQQTIKNIQYALSQSEIASVGMTESNQLNALNQLKEEYSVQLEELRKKEDTLRDKLASIEVDNSVRAYNDLFLNTAIGLDEDVKNEINEKTKAIKRDIDSITSQLFGERSAMVIAQDIENIKSSINTLEEKIKSGITAEAFTESVNLIKRYGTELNALNKELRLRYLATGEEVKYDNKNLRVEAIALQTRLQKAVENLKEYRQSAIDYGVYRKGELTAEGEIIKQEIDTVEGIQKTTEAFYGRESYDRILSALNYELSELLNTMRESGISEASTISASYDIYQAFKTGNVESLKEGIRLLQLEAGKISDKPLQIRASEQIKLLGNRAEDIMDAFRYREKPPSPKIETYGASEINLVDVTRKEAERIVERRLEKFTSKLPEYVRRYTQADLMDYLRQVYDEDYFNLNYEGEYKNLDEYLSVEKIESELRQEQERQNEIRRRERDLQIHETEKKLTDDFINKVTKPSLKEELQERKRELEKQIQKKKVELADKVKFTIPLKETIDVSQTQEISQTQEKRGVAPAKTGTTAIEEARSKEKAAREIRKAQRKLAEERKDSVFPGIETKVKVYTRSGNEYETTREHIGAMTPEQAQRLYGDEFRLVDAYGTQRIGETQRDISVWLTPEQAIQQSQEMATELQPATAVESAISTELATEIATEVEIQEEPRTETETETEVEIITDEKTKIKIPIPFPIELPETEYKKKVVEIPRGAATWRQGNHWGYITKEELAKPEKKKEVNWLAEDEIPAGIYKYAEGAGSTYKTIQVLPKGAEFEYTEENPALVDMGWADVAIYGDNGDVSMSFAGGKKAAEERWMKERGESRREKSQIPSRVETPLSNVKEVYPPEFDEEYYRKKFLNLVSQANSQGYNIRYDDLGDYTAMNPKTAEEYGYDIGSDEIVLNSQWNETYKDRYDSLKTELEEMDIGSEPVNPYEANISKIRDNELVKNQKKKEKRMIDMEIKRKEQEMEDDMVLIPEHYRRKKNTVKVETSTLPTREYLGVKLRQNSLGLGI